MSHRLGHDREGTVLYLLTRLLLNNMCLQNVTAFNKSHIYRKTFNRTDQLKKANTVNVRSGKFS